MNSQGLTTEKLFSQLYTELRVIRTNLVSITRSSVLPSIKYLVFSHFLITILCTRRVVILLVRMSCQLLDTIDTKKALGSRWSKRTRIIPGSRITGRSIKRLSGTKMIQYLFAPTGMKKFPREHSLPGCVEQIRWYLLNNRLMTLVLYGNTRSNEIS